ncbi:bifunctional glutamate N-acetyltransferase/amino-acid acetyltransferase ArgJ [Telmatocola sphagniphila]|uniref:Arginine biosynthesis bifunctional protein ArgJ n=1 Tax=Telmatocola sphagniphila TaxID=1123043 RepID=A0A8E6EZE6_9BACT|nr:bifunctional glutamate N-acetyltransferase/amino-acid acetyltransferase ArgJ [Telmatocola sphagniphila]QVL33668.1 bifunctional glutamate N-acetyltransferase/amino-acid acetyltransferase ArgJ [Telmatocola sphagniphila]
MEEWQLAQGFSYSGIVSKLRNEPNRRDLAVIYSKSPAAAAGVFTQNRVAAAPVHICRERVPSSKIHGIVICSGNANACTGDQGMADARRMTELAANKLGCQPDQFLVCSTGVIGRPLPMAIMEAGIPSAVDRLSADKAGLNDAAHAILTTDTVIKVATRKLMLGQDRICITGFAKGAAMIGPNMATMLGFVMTDASVDPKDLQMILRNSVEHTFNCISVEGHTSTNDTVLILANGRGEPLSGERLQQFAMAVQEVCSELSRGIASDAEGAKHLVIIDVVGTRTDAEAKTVAKTIADSALVKTAIFGADPNWGRVVSAAGYSGVIFEEKDLSLTMGPTLLYERGRPLPFDAKIASAYLRDNRTVHLKLTFTLGEGKCTFYTCDLTDEYVRLNADYTT